MSLTIVQFYRSTDLEKGSRIKQNKTVGGAISISVKCNAGMEAFPMCL